MRRRMAALISLCLLLGGCSPSMEVENQAYVLVMGLDRADDGSMEVSICVPKIGQSSQAGQGSKDDDGPYLYFSADGADFAEAMDRLQIMTPRELNLSHIKLIAASESLAREESFGELIETVAEMPHLYTTARFAVCEGRAGDFIDGMKTVIGTRLSAELTAMFNHFALHGYIPDGSFAEIYYACKSMFSDPTAAWGFQLSGEEGAQGFDPAIPGDAIRKSPASRLYAGSAVFRNGTLALHLDVTETQLMNLALGSVKSFTRECGGKPFTLTPDAKPKKRVTTTDGRLRLSLEIVLLCAEQIGPAQARDIENELAGGLTDLIRKCQSQSVDPLGFAECAAAGFATIPDWLAYDWRSRFPAAETEVRVCVKCSEVS